MVGPHCAVAAWATGVNAEAVAWWALQRRLVGTTMYSAEDLEELRATATSTVRDGGPSLAAVAAGYNAGRGRGQGIIGGGGGGGRPGGGGRGYDEEPPPLYSIHEGSVVRTTDFGAFVELPGYRRHGLVHISQLASYKVESVADAVSVGDRVWVKVTEVGDVEDGPRGPQRKIGLSMRYCDQSNGSDLDPTNTDLQAAKERRGNGGGGRGPQRGIELGAVLNVTCPRCGGRGHLASECFNQPGGTKYELIPEPPPEEAGGGGGGGGGSGSGSGSGAGSGGSSLTDAVALAQQRAAQWRNAVAKAGDNASGDVSQPPPRRRSRWDAAGVQGAIASPSGVGRGRGAGGVPGVSGARVTAGLGAGRGRGATAPAWMTNPEAMSLFDKTGSAEDVGAPSSKRDKKAKSSKHKSRHHEHTSHKHKHKHHKHKSHRRDGTSKSRKHKKDKDRHRSRKDKTSSKGHSRKRSRRSRSSSSNGSGSGGGSSDDGSSSSESDGDAGSAGSFEDAEEARRVVEEIMRRRKAQGGK